MKVNLKDVQKRLEEAGVTHVQFVFSEDVREYSLEEVKESAARVLTAILNGESTPWEPFDDKNIPLDLEERIKQGKMKQIMKAAKKEFPDWLGEV